MVLVDIRHPPEKRAALVVPLVFCETVRLAVVTVCCALAP